MSKKGECYFHKEPWLKETCSKFQVITLSLDALLPKKGPYFLIYFDVIRSLLSNITWNGFWYLLCSVDWVFFCILPIPLVIFPPPLEVVQRGPCGVENHKWPWWSKNELYISIPTRNLIFGIQRLLGETSVKNNIAREGCLFSRGALPRNHVSLFRKV